MARSKRAHRIGTTAALGAAALALAGCPRSEPVAPPPALDRRGPAPIRVSDDPWVLSTTAWGGDYRACYLGNGYLGQRVFESGTPYSAGRPEHGYLAGAWQGESAAPMPPLLPLRIKVGDRSWDREGAGVTAYRQELRVRDGLLVTRGAWNPGNGPIELELETALLRQHPDIALVRAKITNRGRAAVGVALDREGGTSGRFGEALTMRYDAPVGAVTSFLQALDRNDVPTASEDAAGYSLPSGQAATFALVTQVTGGPAALKGEPARFAALDAALIDRWLAEHRQAWRELWQRDIEIEGDAEAQQVVRGCLFQLLASTRPENDRGIPPMGLSANAFNGHVFWDMDSWMLPALLPQHPEAARGMLEYRFQTLPGARANAKAEGLPGASYAWESAASGRETIPNSIYRHGRHVSGDVALALRQYHAATNDAAWLRARAWPILRATADNWVARAKPDGKGGFLVRGVTTPDESAGQVDHSAWTHHVARVNLDFATEAARAVGAAPDPHWARVSRGLTFLRDPKTRLILPYARFTERTKAKQADVLLLCHPGELELSEAELGSMYDYYAPKVIANGPAMTDAIHAVVAARLGRGEEALNRFRLSYQPFVRPPYHAFSEKRTRDNLNFLTGAAGVVEGVIYGFAGLRLEGDGNAGRPLLRPHLPPGWTALRLRRLQWRGRTWDVEILPGAPPKWSAARDD